MGLLVHGTIGPLDHWSIGPLVHWSIGPLVHWSIIPLVHWSIGSLVECQMLNVIKVKLLSERTSGVPPVIFAIVTSITLVITLGSVLSSNSKHLLLGWLNQLSSLSVSVGLSSIWPWIGHRLYLRKIWAYLGVFEISQHIWNVWAYLTCFGIFGCIWHIWASPITLSITL